MSSFMGRAAARLLRHRRVVIAAWVVLVLASLPFAAHQTENLVSGGFTVPGSQSDQVRGAAENDFGLRDQLALVLVPTKGSNAVTRSRETGRLLRGVREVPKAMVTARAGARARATTAHGRTAVVPIGVLVDQQHEADVAREIETRIGDPERALSADLIGEGALNVAIQGEAQKQLTKAEAIGFPIVLVILLVIFGSLAAAVLPLALGIAAVVLTGAMIYLLSQVFLISVFATNTATMFGIALAVDYTMFILVRFREEIRAGRDRDDAIAKALSTSGVAIVYSGLTVIVAIGSLWLYDNAGLRSLAGCAMLTVAISVLLSTMLLPVLLRLFSDRLVRQRHLLKGLRRRQDPPRPEGAFWERWAAVVLGRPVLFGGAALLTLLVLAVPTLSLIPGEDVLSQLPSDNNTRVGYEHAAAAQGPGAASPVQVLLRSDGRRPVGRRSVVAARRTIAADPEVVRVGRPAYAGQRHLALLSAIPSVDGGSAAAKDLVRRLRTAFAGDRAPPGQVTAYVGGVTAYNLDFQEQVFGGLWKVGLFGLFLTVVLLTLLLRSVILPIKAVILNVLTIAAAYGVVVVVFQWGWFDGFLGFESTGSVSVFTLPLIITTVFGLSMDYEIFLLSRIRERYERTGDPDAAIAQGLAGSARPITGAALIMVAVFAVFATTSLVSVKELGLALAVAIAIDATLVRLVLVPATMQMFGRWNWWLPRPLAGLAGPAAPEAEEEPAQ
jgi:uncharacterized membrane protein YdfJ with MMPL/SSD domain